MITFKSSSSTMIWVIRSNAKNLDYSVAVERALELESDEATQKQFGKGFKAFPRWDSTTRKCFDEYAIFEKGS